MVIIPDGDVTLACQQQNKTGAQWHLPVKIKIYSSISFHESEFIPPATRSHALHASDEVSSDSPELILE